MTEHNFNFYIDTYSLYSYRSNLNFFYKKKIYDPRKDNIVYLNFKVDTTKVNLIYKLNPTHSENVNRLGKSSFCYAIANELENKHNHKVLMIHAWSNGLILNPYQSIKQNLKNLLGDVHQFDETKFEEVASILWDKEKLEKQSLDMSEEKLLILGEGLDFYDEISLLYVYSYLTGIDTLILDEIELFYVVDGRFLYQNRSSFDMEIVFNAMLDIAKKMIPYVTTVISTNQIGMVMNQSGEGYRIDGSWAVSKRKSKDEIDLSKNSNYNLIDVSASKRLG